MKQNERSGVFRRRYWISFFVLLSLCFAVGGLLFYRSEAQRIRQERYLDLKTVAELKASQISQWRMERLADVAVASRSPFFARAVADRLIGGHGSGRTAELKARMRLEKTYSGYADVLLISREGRILCSLSPHGRVEPADAQAIDASAQKRTAVLSEPYRSYGGTTFIDAVAPVMTKEGRLAAMLVYRIDADVFLYPLVRSWPSPSRSAETVVVRRDGDSVLYLNELRSQRNAALTLRLPLSREDNPSVQAVLGKKGMFAGRDYRNVEVMADLRPVPRSPWFMVAKVDTGEILAGARSRAEVVSLVVFLLILLVALAAAYLYRLRQAHLYRALYRAERAERESRELFRATLYSIGDAVITADGDGRVRQMNPVAERLTGWREAEAQGKAIQEVFHIVNEETRREAESPVEHVLRVGTVAGLGNHTVLLSRDGREYPIADSGAPIRDEKGNFLGVVMVFRDQARERAAEAALQESEERYRLAIESSNDGVAIVKDGRHLYVNRKYLEMFGYGLDDVSEKPATSIVHPDDRERVAEFVVKGQRGEPTPRHYEFKGVRRDGSPIYVEASTSVITYRGGPAGLGFFRDISGRRRAESRKDLTNMILTTLNSPRDIKTLTRDILHLLKEHIGAESAGVRMRSGEDYPFLETIGFPQDLLDAENSLFPGFGEKTVLQDERGRRCLACLCGSVIDATTDGISDFFTDYGSFWTNNASSLLSTVGGQAEAKHLRGRCIAHGFQSIALIPLRSGDDVVGLLHFAERRQGLFTREDVEFLEGMGSAIGIALLRKEAEERIRASEEKYRNIFENAMEGIFRRTPEGVLLGVNPALARMHGYASPEEMMLDVVDVSKKRLIVNDEEDARYRALLEKEGVARGFEAEHYRKDGSTFLASFDTRAVMGSNGKTLYYDGIVQDITDKRMMEEQLRQAQKMEAIGTLAGGVAHDFNNLLTVIMGFSNLIQMSVGPDDPLRPYVDQIVTSSNKAADLTQSLLAFSRKQRITLEPHKVNDVLKSTAKLLMRLLPEDIDLRLELGPTDPTARLDLTQIDQVLMNLATNARDAMPRGGLLSIRTGESTLDEAFKRERGFGNAGRYALLSVSDTGIGMDERTMARIFDPFFTTKEVGKGTGLGLASVYGIVNQHNGYITVSSDLRKGTTFDIYLPLVDEGAQEKAVPVEGIGGGAERILIVEDDPDVRKMLTKMLESQG